MFQMKSVLAAATLALAMVSGAAQAGTVLYDNFNTENGGASQTNYFGFANWDVISNPNATVNLSATVDIIGPGNPWDLGGYGSYVDLDGSSGVGGTLITKNAYSFGAGQAVNLTFALAGNQRQGTDDFFSGFQFLGATDISNFTISGAWGPYNYGPYTGISGISVGTSVASTVPWLTYSVSFTANSSGSLKAFIGTTSNDNIGPLLDDVNLSVAPEPASWALMLAGFAGMGAALRANRRRLTLTA